MKKPVCVLLAVLAARGVAFRVKPRVQPVKITGNVKTTGNVVYGVSNSCNRAGRLLRFSLPLEWRFRPVQMAPIQTTEQRQRRAVGTVRLQLLITPGTQVRLRSEKA